MNYFDFPNASQPIPVRVRPDLRVEQVDYQSERYWVVKDPHDQKYYHLNEQEYAILGWLDGKASFVDIRDKFEASFAPFQANFSEITQVIRDFIQKAVVIPVNGNVGIRLHEHAREKRRKELQQKLKSITAIKWKGWDPEKFLNLTYPYCSWLFSRAGVTTSLSLCAIVLAWVLIRFDEFFGRLPDLWSFVNPENWGPLGLAITTSKLFHELGHAYTNKQNGGECHEIGVMIFFFMPTLYCNTSDSWMLRDKWQRMYIGLGGVYIELLMFTFAAIGWWFSNIGVFNSVCLNLMFVCSVSAVLTNGNPLLKYDGYFVLADWLEIPNLAQRSNERIKKVFLRHGLGIEKEVDLWTSTFNKKVFLSYGIAAFLFRLFLIATIAYFLISQFAVVGLQHIAVAIGLMAVGSIFFQPAKAMYDYFIKTPGNRRRVKRNNLLVTSGLLLAVVIVVGLIPFPYYVTAECSVHMQSESPISIRESGVLAAVHVQPGETVTAGQLLAEISNVALERERLSVQRKIAEVKAELKNRLGASRFETQTDGQSLGMYEQQLASLEDEWRILDSRSNDLMIRAPQDGAIIAITIGDRSAESDDEHLNKVFGSLLDKRNRNAFVNKGDILCKVVSGSRQQVSCVIEPRHATLVAEGQEAIILLSTESFTRIKGRVSFLSLQTQKADLAPESVAAESSSAAISRAKQLANPETRKDLSYKDGQTLSSRITQAVIDLDCDRVQSNNATGKAKIRIGNRTVCWRLFRAIRELVHTNL